MNLMGRDQIATPYLSVPDGHSLWRPVISAERAYAPHPVFFEANVKSLILTIDAPDFIFTVSLLSALKFTRRLWAL